MFKISRLLQVALAILTLPGPLFAEGLYGSRAGGADIFVNDILGDGHDRWRSGGYSKSWLFEDGAIGDGEVRLRFEVITPWSPAYQGASNDRLNVGIAGLGSFWERELGSTRFKYGAEVVALGEQTGIHSFQEGFHDAIGYDKGYNLSDRLEPMIEDSFSGMISGEISHDLQIGRAGLFRPYAGLQAGYETYARVGGDIVIGNLRAVERWVRDPITGFIIPSEKEVEERSNPGVSLIAGADYTQMMSSEYFPEAGQVELESSQVRLRAGLQANMGRATIFWGVAQMPKEFTTQSEPQKTGVLSIDLMF